VGANGVPPDHLGRDLNQGARPRSASDSATAVALASLDRCDYFRRLVNCALGSGLQIK